MNNKYLPIGSVVFINETHKKVMISGYKGVRFNGELEFFDYTAISYPEGLLDGSSYVFNECDIKSVIFKGYDSSEFTLLIEGINIDNKSVDAKETDNENIEKNLFYKKPVQIQTDELIFDKLDSDIKITNDIITNDILNLDQTKTSEDNLTLNDVMSNDTVFKFDENGVVTANHPLKDDLLNSQITENIPLTQTSFKFDENGIVITDGTNSVVKDIDNLKEYKNPEFNTLGQEKVESKSIDEPVIVPIKLDEKISALNNDLNKFIITEQKEESRMALKFDENGYVID